MSDRLLITGATGWLGRALLHALNGRPARALVLPGEAPAHADVAAVEGDLRNPTAAKELCAGGAGATVLHLAGLIHPRRVRDLYAVNVEGSRNVLDAAAAAGVRRVVLVSSNSPCGCNPARDHLFDEQAPYRPYMHYGKSKMQMEQLARTYADRLEVVVLRGTWFYGPHQPPRQTTFFRMIRDGGAPVVGGGENRRSMTYVDNLVQGLLLAADTPAAAGQTYWIADERPYTMNEIIDTVEALLENEFGQTCRHKRLRLPGFASTVAYGVDATLQGLGLYHQKIHVLSEMNRTIACSIDKARRELGYRPEVGLEEGMRRSLAWIMERGGL